MPTPCPGSGRRMESTHIRSTRSLWLCSFPSLSSIQIHRIELYFLVVCRSSIICSSTFESKLWVHTVVHCLLCTSPSAAYFVSTCSLSLCMRWLSMSDKCVLVAMMMQQIERYRHKFVVQRRRLRQSKPPHQRLPIRRRRKRRGRGGDHGCETPAHRNRNASKVNTAFSLAHDSSDSENESATINWI